MHWDKKKFIKKTKDLLTSMRFLIVCLMILLAIMPVVSFDIIFLDNYKQNILKQKKEEIKIETEKLSLKLTKYIKDKKYSLKFNNINENAEILKTISSFFSSVYIINSDGIIIDDTGEYSKGQFIISDAVFRAFEAKTIIKIDEIKKTVICATPIVGNDDKKVEGVIYISYPIDTTLRNIEAIQRTVRIIEITILIISIILAYITAILFTRPYNRMVKEISNFSGTNIKEIDVSTFYESRQICEAFNSLIKKQVEEDKLKQEFVSNVSHELKTPITSIKVLVDSLLQQEGLTVDIYREFLQDVSSEVDRESKIISDLLSLSRLEKNADKMEFENTSINEILLMVIKRIEPIAVQKNIRILFDEFENITASVDKIKMSLVFTNLIENAIKYNIENGWIRISLTFDYKYFYFTITDGGIGIALDEQDYIFERFYRIDKSRTSAIGGTGLGLSIVKSIIQRHNGAIKVSSDGENGSTFIFRIPLER